MKVKNIIHILFLGMTVCLLGCQGKDGDPGPGYAEAIKYGNIKVAISSKRPIDNVEFKSESDFKFFPTASGPYGSSTVKTNIDGQRSFTVQRFISGVDLNNQSNNNSFYFSITVSPTGEVTSYYFSNRNTVITSNKSFELYQAMWSDETADTSEIKDFTFDSSTGRLKFNFSWNVNAANSSTGNDITMTGVVNVIVLEAINNINNSPG